MARQWWRLDCGVFESKLTLTEAGTVGSSERVKAAESEPRAQSKDEYGWSGRHARLNGPQYRVSEDRSPLYFRLSLVGTGREEG